MRVLSNPPTCLHALSVAPFDDGSYTAECGSATCSTPWILNDFNVSAYREPPVSLRALDVDRLEEAEDGVGHEASPCRERERSIATSKTVASIMEQFENEDIERATLDKHQRDNL